MRSIALALAACLCRLGPSVAAEMPEELAEAVKKIGPVINPPETAKLYGMLHAKEPYRYVVVTRDETYGTDARNRLDVFRPASAAGALPVLIFVHGGGYERGDKRPPADSPFYDNVMLWAAGNGMVGVNMTYRPAPANAWPAAAEDVSAAVAWTKANAARLGGDPNRIFLMGHSAGGTHVAAYIADRKFHDGGGPGLAGAILVSGTFELNPEIEVPGQRSYFGADGSKWAERSSVKGLAESKLPLLVAHGEGDVPYYTCQAETLKAALCAQQRCPILVTLKGHSHMSEIDSVNTSDTSLTEPLLAFIKSGQ
jgi:triacylglycerol lipase